MWLSKIGAIQPEGRAEVVKVDADDALDQQVRRARRPAAQRVLLPILPPAAHQIEAALGLLDKQRNVFWKMLQVRIHRDDELAERRN